MSIDEYFKALEYCINLADKERGLKVLEALRTKIRKNKPVEIREVVRVVEPLRYNRPLAKKKGKRKRILCWGTLKRDIRRRDEDKCRICSNDYYLHVHHIDHNHTNNKESNLVTLCESCHISVHEEGYKPSDNEDIPAPWDRTSPNRSDLLNQEYSW